MRTHDDLTTILHRIDGRGYKAYKDIGGEYAFPGFRLSIDHVQGDPFAAPSRLRVFVALRDAGFPDETRRGKARAVALATEIARAFAAAAGRVSERRGSGGSGRIEIDRPGQEVLERTAVIVHDDEIEARFTAGLPAAGRRVLGREADRMLAADLPEIVRASLLYEAHDAAAIGRAVRVNEDAESLRSALADLGLVAFVADGSVLPRRSGVDDRPLDHGAVPFRSPPSLRVTVDLPNAGRVSGLGIPAGVTLIAGGGFHGKSTLLAAIERGVYDHRPDDGREYVAADARTVKIRAEDGRRVAGVDISSFIGELPYGRTTDFFTSDNASGSTSQAANIVEALEAGARVLLVDEDTAATNFMIRDERMRRLVAKEKEPITPFVERVRGLHRDLGVSTVLVVGGSGDYFDVADTVIVMDSYVPRDATSEAAAIAAALPSERSRADGAFREPAPRIPVPASVDPSRGRREVSVKVHGRATIRFGEETVDLSAVSQIVDPSQTRALAAAILYARRTYMDGRRPIGEIVRAVAEDLGREGLRLLSDRPVGDHAAFRPLELAAALNRLRSLQIARK